MIPLSDYTSAILKYVRQGLRLRERAAYNHLAQHPSERCPLDSSAAYPPFLANTHQARIFSMGLEQSFFQINRQYVTTVHASHLPRVEKTTTARQAIDATSRNAARVLLGGLLFLDFVFCSLQ